MSDSAIELTAEELELIQQKRDQEAERARAEEERKRADYERWKRREVSEAERAVALANQLRDADTKGILLIEEGTKTVEHSLGNFSLPTVKVTWFLNGQEEEVDITFHSTARYNSFRTGEMKFLLCGGFNDYASRYYKRASTVIARIEEYQELAEIRQRNKRRKASLAVRAVAELKEKYPNADVEFLKGYDYRGRAHGSYAPDRVCVSSKNGSYTFTYRENDKELLEFSVWERKIGKELDDKIRELVLGAE